VYARTVNGRTLTFGVSGKLIRNSLVMYDRETHSLWTHLTGGAIDGPLRLGLWTITFPSYTTAAFNTAAGRQALAGMGAKNGFDLDGTPLLFSTSDIVGLENDGFVQLRHRAFGGSQGFPWVI
jgi:hypothetical protein